MPVLIGTSGWMYKHWRGLLYPKKLGDRTELEYYAERFETVELNNSFYRLPEKEMFESWRRRTPDGFVFAVKASRYLTHMKPVGMSLPVERRLTTDWSYIRMHQGRRGIGFGKRELETWAGHIADLRRQAEIVYVYFNNYAGGHALEDADSLRRLLPA